MPNNLYTGHPSPAMTGLIFVKLIIFDSIKAELRALPFHFVSLTVYLQLTWELSLQFQGQFIPSTTGSLK